MPPGGEVESHVLHQQLTVARASRPVAASIV
jgi:hypothetical protein